MTARERLLLQLAEAGATLDVQLAAHQVPLELFDEFPGEAREYESNGRRWRTKSGRTNGLTWSVYSVDVGT